MRVTEHKYVEPLKVDNDAVVRLGRAVDVNRKSSIDQTLVFRMPHLGRRSPL